MKTKSPRRTLTVDAEATTAIAAAASKFFMAYLSLYVENDQFKVSGGRHSDGLPARPQKPRSSTWLFGKFLFQSSRTLGATAQRQDMH